MNYLLIFFENWNQFCWFVSLFVIENNYACKVVFQHLYTFALAKWIKISSFC